MEHDGWTYIFLRCGRKAWHYDHLHGWEQVAYERGDYIECYVFRKMTASLCGGDIENWVKPYGERPDGEWFDPSDWKDPRDRGGFSRCPPPRGSGLRDFMSTFLEGHTVTPELEAAIFDMAGAWGRRVREVALEDGERITIEAVSKAIAGMKG